MNDLVTSLLLIWSLLCLFWTLSLWMHQKRLNRDQNNFHLITKVIRKNRYEQ